MAEDFCQGMVCEGKDVYRLIYQQSPWERLEGQF